MIKKTILICFTLLVVYSIGVALIKPDRFVAQHQWQNNSIQAQKFLYDDHSPNVIIGSSLAARLDFTNTPGFFNLAFSGQSAMDGLTILAQKNRLPKNVYIEMNTILVKENEMFTASLLNPILYHTRRILDSFRDGKQPLGFVATSVTNAIKKRTRLEVNEKKINKKKTVPSNLRKELMADQIKKYSQTPHTEEISQAFRKLKQHVTFLKQHGVTVIFFEMPVNEALCGLMRSAVIRDAFAETFPANQYLYISQPDCSNYHTSDGIHLYPNEATRYKKYFLSKTPSP